MDNKKNTNVVMNSTGASPASSTTVNTDNNSKSITTTNSNNNNNNNSNKSRGGGYSDPTWTWQDRKGPVGYIKEPWTEQHWKSWFADCREDAEYMLNKNEIIGTIPSELIGTFGRNGPSFLSSARDREPIHLIDSDGLLVHISIFKDEKTGEQKVFYRNKIIATDLYVTEKKAGGRILFPRLFGTQAYGSNFISRWYKNTIGSWGTQNTNIANTHQVRHGENHILALYEGYYYPTIIDAKTLNYVKEETFHGSLTGEYTYSAHPRIDSVSNHIVNFGIVTTLISARCCITEHENKLNGKLVSIAVFEIPDFPKLVPVIHSFAVSQNYILVHCGPVKPNAMKGILRNFITGIGLDDGIAGISGKDDPTATSRVFMIKRQKVFDAAYNARVAKKDYLKFGSEIMYFEGAPCFIYHHVNAYDDPKTNNVILDSFAFEKLVPLDIIRQGHDGRHCKLVRMVFSPLNGFGSLEKPLSYDYTVRVGRSMLMPTFDTTKETLKERYIYAIDSDEEPYTGVVKMDAWEGKVVSTFRLSPGEYAQESIFAPNPKRNPLDPTDEDNGWLLQLVFDGNIKRSYLAIYDARALSKGSIAKIMLRNHVPYSFHCNYFANLIPDTNPNSNHTNKQRSKL